MEQNLRGLFERALDDEPVPPPGDLTRAAMAQGTRLRRRRQVLAGGAAGVLGMAATVGALHLAAPAEPPAAAMAVPDRSCTASAEDYATDVSIFLRTDVTDAERRALEEALRSDARVGSVVYEGHEAAFSKFKILWRDDPGFVDSVEPDSLAESFRVRMAQPDRYPALRADLDRVAGVEDVLGSTCP